MSSRPFLLLAVAGLALAPSTRADDDPPPGQEEKLSIEACLQLHGAFEPGQEEVGIEGLARYKSPEIVKAALALIATSTDHDTLVGAATYLGTAPVRASAGPKEDRPAVLRKRLEAPKLAAPLRLALIEALGAMGDARNSGLIEGGSLLEAQAAARGLGRSTEVSAHLHLLDTMARFRAEITANDESVPGLGLVDMAATPTPQLRYQVVLLVAREVMGSPRGGLMVEAVKNLAAPTEHLFLLEWALDEPTRMQVRGIGVELLEEQDPSRRAAGLRLITSSRCLDDGDEERLVFHLRDPDPAVRVAAANAMLFFGRKAQLPALAQLLDDPEVAVQQAALKALTTLTRQKFPGKRALWERWLETEAKRPPPSETEAERAGE